MCNGILQSYHKWVFHGESSEEHNANQPQPRNEEMHANMQQLINDAFGHIYDNVLICDGNDLPNTPVYCHILNAALQSISGSMN